MTLFISPTEPASLKEIGKSHLLPESYGVDVLFSSGGKLAGIQRKKFPDDFRASLSDGRLVKEYGQMAALDFPCLLLEGQGRWVNGSLGGFGVQVTRSQFWGFCASSWWIYGVPVFVTDGLAETISFVQWYVKWVSKARHDGLRARPKAKDDWNSGKSPERQIHFLQGLPGVGVKTAEAMVGRFGGVPMRWDVGEEELRELPGVGSKKAAELVRFLER